ncbi:response regulator, partial [Dermabacteraceae bacterium P13101]
MSDNGLFPTGTPATPIRVLIADDQHLVRGALVTLLGLEDDLAVVADVGTGREVLPAAQTARADVALVDIDMPSGTGAGAFPLPAGARALGGGGTGETGRVHV